MTVARSMSPIKTHSISPTLTYKTPSLLNISNQDEELKDAKIKELEETIMALRRELAEVKNLKQENGGASILKNGYDQNQENNGVNPSPENEIESNNDNGSQFKGETENHLLNTPDDEMHIQMN